MSQPSQVYEQLMRYLDGTLSGQEKEDVEYLLERDVEARDILRGIAEQAVVVADEIRGAGVRGEVIRGEVNRGEQAKVQAGENPFGAMAWEDTANWENTADWENTAKNRRADRSWTIPAFAALVAMLLLAVGISWYWFQVERDAPKVITITALNGPIEWSGDGGRVVNVLDEGMQLPGGTIELRAPDTWIEFEFNDGSTVTLTGQSTVTISDQGQKRIHLRSGSLSADVEVQPSGQPMLVHTQVADLTVVGTQFNVDVERSLTVVSVNEGQVRVKRLSDNKSLDVGANHRVIAAADPLSDFNVKEQSHPVSQWQSQLPNGIVYGEWDAKASMLRATPMLWHDCKKEDQEPLLLFLAATSVSRGKKLPVELRSDAHFRIRGRMKEPKDLLIGVTTVYLRGGFAGKHHVIRKAEAFQKDSDFELLVPIEEFVPQAAEYPSSAVGLGLYDWWCHTIFEDAGLGIKSVELIDNSEISEK